MGTNRRIWWLLLAVIAFAALFAPPAIAQEKSDLVIRFSPGSYLDRVEPGKDNRLYLEVENFGNRALTNIRLTVDAPEGWLVEMDPAVIANLSPGSVVPIDVNVKPVSGSDRRDNRINFIAEGDGLRRVLTIWVRVENGTSLWMWVGLALAVAVITGFVLIFLRIGRQ